MEHSLSWEYNRFSATQKTVPTREGEGGSRNKLPGPWGPAVGTRPDYVAYVFVFRGSIRRNEVVICRADGTGRQRPSCLWRFVLCFLTFTLAGPPLLGGPKKEFSLGPRTRSRQPCQEISTFYGTCRFNAAFTTARHLPVFRARSIQ